MKKVIIAIVIVIILAIGGAVIAMNRKSGSTTSGTSATSGNSQQSQSSGPTATNSVTITNFAFSPADITVKKGTTVIWTNQDSVSHTVRETDGQTGPNSSTLSQGKSYSFTYDTTGTFKYHCSIHPDMTGTVTVTE